MANQFLNAFFYILYSALMQLSYWLIYLVLCYFPYLFTLYVFCIPQQIKKNNACLFPYKFQNPYHANHFTPHGPWDQWDITIKNKIKSYLTNFSPYCCLLEDFSLNPHNLLNRFHIKNRRKVKYFSHQFRYIKWFEKRQLKFQL